MIIFNMVPTGTRNPKILLEDAWEAALSKGPLSFP